MRKLAYTLLPWALALGVITTVGVARWRGAQAPPRPDPVELLGSLGAPVSSSEGLAERVQQLEQRLKVNAEDTGARIALAEVLLRQARVTGNAALTARAKDHLDNALRVDPGDYDASRMLGVVLLSLHRFDEAIAAGQRARSLRPDDPWNYGVIGDGQLELGRYDEAFASFQRMMDLRPSAASYARASYALELQGRLDEALDSMQKAVNATSPRDAEGLAWAIVHVGDLLAKQGRLPEAETHYQLAHRVFPDHPFATIARARVAAARGETVRAIELARTVLDRSPSMAIAAFVGDLYAKEGHAADAERYYRTAEAIAGESKSTDEPFAGFLAERGRRLDDAVRLAEQVAMTRQDIKSLDALAWALFKVGRIADAQIASEKALRTGTRERKIVLHAATIAAAANDRARMRQLVERAAPADPEFDVLMAKDVAAAMAAATGAGPSASALMAGGVR
ncbi:MAG: tetratricopeptide repeat protein [Vicinamibacterales bacterium]